MKCISTLLVVLLLTTITPLPGQPDSQNQTVTILEYGFPRTNDYRNAQATVGERWGIEFRSVAGCMVTQEVIDSVALQNEQSNTFIIEKFGPDWREEFNEEVEEELVVQQEVRELIDSQDYIISLDSTLRAKRQALIYLLKAEDSDKVYSAIIFGSGEWTDKPVFFQYYLLQIDLMARTVEIENDVVELFTIE